MVQQYNQNNINAPRGSNLFSADATLDLDSDMVVVTTADGAVTLTLPAAPQIPGQEVVVKANDAGSTGNAVTLAALPGQNIDGAATIDLTEDQESVCLKSDGSNWRRVCSGAGGGGSCCSPTYIWDGVWDGNTVPNLSGPPGTLMFAASSCGQDEPLSAVFRQAFPLTPGQPPPTVTGVTLTTTSTTIVLAVGYDSSLSPDGNYVLEIENACGCCHIIPVTIQGG